MRIRFESLKDMWPIGGIADVIPLSQLLRRVGQPHNRPPLGHNDVLYRSRRVHPPGSVEHIIVTQGRAIVGLTDAPEELGEGDYICYPADRPHIFQALEPDTHALLVAEQN